MFVSQAVEELLGLNKFRTRVAEQRNRTYGANVVDEEDGVGEIVFIHKSNVIQT